LLYAAAAVAAAVFAAVQPERLSGWVPGLRWIAPVSFVVATEFVYWSGWHDLRLALALTLVGGPLFLLMRRGQPRSPAGGGVPGGGWILRFPLGPAVVSWARTFKGSGDVPAPYDSLLVAV